MGGKTSQAGSQSVSGSHCSGCMTLVVTTSLSSILQILSDTEMNGDAEFDKLELRNRTVTETLSPVEDLGQDKEVNTF